MTVYFISKVDDPGQIKIGTTCNLKQRIAGISRYVGPVKVLATMDGGPAVERAVHSTFSDLWIEGEWYRSAPILREYIKVNAEPCDEVFGKPVRVWEREKPTNRRQEDSLIAGKLLDVIVEKYPRAVSVAQAMEKVFQELSASGTGWSRRRVKAIRERTGLRIDVYELADLLKLARIPRSEWSDWIAPEISDL